MLAVVCGALLLCYPAVYNRYPLVYTDSGTYLDSAITFHASWNRPFFYSLFLLGLHLRTSLWLIPLGQALIVTYLLHLVVASLFPTLGTLAFVFLMALLATFSSLPWFASEIMPDVFCPVVVLTTFLLAFARDSMKRVDVVFVWLMLAVAVMSHLSNVPLAIGMLGVTAIAVPLTRAPGVREALMLIGTSITAALAALVLGNYVATGEMSLSSYAAPIFTLSRMIEDGSATAYLRETCGVRRYRLCDYLDRLPMPMDDFLWRTKDSPLYVIGVHAARDEAREIVAGALRSHPWMQLEATWSNVAQQLRLHATGAELSPRLSPWFINDVVAAWFPAEYESYRTSRQNTGTLHMAAVASLNDYALYVSLLLFVSLSALCIQRSHVQAVRLALFVVCGILGNAIIVGALSTPASRYESRIAWLGVFWVAAVCIGLITGRGRQHLGRCERP